MNLFHQKITGLIRVFECCYSLVHHMDDITSYLEKFSSVVNGLSITDCSFLEIEVLKPIFLCIYFNWDTYRWSVPVLID